MAEDKKRYLVFDTETTGVPRVYGAPAHHLDNWPRLVQLAWLVAEEDGTVLWEHNGVVRPDGFRIPWRAAWVHGITTRKALREGQPLKDVLKLFADDMEKVSVLIAHNMAFDEKIVGAELLRCGETNNVELMPRRCTMKWSTRLVGIAGPKGFKWPNLQELHKALFGKGFRGAHNAMVDVRACARCYFELKRRNVMP